MSDRRRGVRLMNDYTVVWPLWWIDGGQVQPGDLDLSEATRERLRAWAAHFNAHFDPFQGWDTPAAARGHAAAADQLVVDLRRELGPDVPVRPDLWELPSG